jgi:ketosteroid isomerase-like protein
MAVAPAEVVTLARDFLAAAVARDTDFIAAHAHDAEDARFFVIGSPPNEHWTLPGMVAHLKDFPPTTFLRSEPSGWAVGDAAWVTDFAENELPDGEILQTRATVVLLRVEGMWKVVHIHLSEGVPHEL